VDAPFYTLKVVHFAAAATWFGHKMLIPGDCRRSVEARGDVAKALITRIERAEKVGIGSGVLTLLSGVALIFLLGGFGAMPWRIHLGLALVLVSFAVGGLGAAPGWARAKKGIEAEDWDEARAGVRRLSVAMNVEQLIWFVVLIVMVVRI